jgi:hypothetical protein
MQAFQDVLSRWECGELSNEEQDLLGPPERQFRRRREGETDQDRRRQGRQSRPARLRLRGRRETLPGWLVRPAHEIAPEMEMSCFGSPKLS